MCRSVRYGFVNYFNSVSSIHSYNSQSQFDNLFVKSVHTTQYGIRSLSYTGPKLWKSLSIDVKKIKLFSSFRQHIKNLVIDGYNTIVLQLYFFDYYLINEVIIFI